MADPNESTDTFSTIEDAMGSYVSDEEQDNGQGGQSEQADEGQPDQLEAGQDEVTDQDPDLDDGTEEIDASEEDPSAEGLVSPDAKFKLADGTVTTVAELARGSLRNADYTRGKTELAQERQKIDEVRTQVRQQYETVTQQQQRLAALAQVILPQPPDPMMMQTDYIGYGIAKEAYERTIQQLQAVDSDYRSNAQMQTEAQKEALEAFRTQQADKLVERDPKFADDKYYRQFWADMQSIGGRVYGYSAKELTEGMNDHRQYLVMRDALAFQRIKANQRKAKGQQGQRQTPQNGTGRQPMAVNGRPQNADVAKRQFARDRFTKNPTINNALDLID